MKSVLDSTYQHLEVIVNDDASTDNTAQILETFNDTRVRFYQNASNVGPAKNWNLALKRASGEFVGLLNHDDLYGPFWLTLATHILEKHPHIGWVAPAFRVVDENSKTLCTILRFTDTREYSRSEAFQCLARLDGLGPAYIARREILEEVGYYDEGSGASADNDLFLRLAARYPLYYSKNPHHAAWRLHSDNLTHRWKYVDQVTEALKTLHKVFAHDTLPAELREHKKSSYTYFYHKVLKRANRLLKQGDLEAVQQLVRLLHTEGYREI